MSRATELQVRGQLVRQHESLDETLREIVLVLGKNDYSAVQAAWTRFENELMEHLELEEKQLLPLVEEKYPEQVLGLRSEHDRIRETAAQLGLACDLHTIRREAVVRFANLLEAHAAAEDSGLYRWVDELAPLETRRQLLGSLLERVGLGRVLHA